MKIYFIGQKGIPALSGGVERHVEELATRLVQEGNEVFVYCRSYYNPSNLQKYKGVQLITLPTLRTKHFDAIFHTLIATIHVLFQPADIIHYHSIGPASLLWIPKLFKRSANVVFTFHCADYYHEKWNGLAKIALRMGEKIGCYFADHIITVSQTLRNYLWNAYHYKATYIPNGVPALQKENESKLIEKWGLIPQGYILTVSRLVRHKGIHKLIEAYKELETDQKLVIVGDSAFTDEYVAQLKAMAGNDPNIIFTGTQIGKTLNQLYTHATVFIQPSESEGLSIALLEAMKFGIPVISTNIPENKEVVRKYGLYFEYNDTEELAAQIRYALTHRDMMLEIAMEGQKMVTAEYNWMNIMRSISDVYKKLRPNDVQKVVMRSAEAKR